MQRRIAPLNALRAFEAAARHHSFARAAEELNVTAAAVSHQVKSLEGYLGRPLFRRLPRALVITESGQLALPLLREAFDKLEEATRQMADATGPEVLTVSVAPSFAAKWLVPRLDEFREANPEIDVLLDASTRVADLQSEEVDIAIRYGPGDYPGAQAVRMMGEEMYPVCSPALLEGENPLREPADLANHILLHAEWRNQDETSPSWPMWLLAAGVTGIDGTRGPRFSLESMAVQSALSGHGVALGSSVLCAADLAAGNLVRPFDLSLPKTFAYYVVVPEGKVDEPHIARFRDWILAEVERDHSEAGKGDDARGVAAA